MRGWPGRAWPRPGGFYACASATLPAQPFRSLTWTGWTMCHTGQFPAPGTRCYLRVRVSLDLSNDLIEEVWAAYASAAGCQGRRSRRREAFTARHARGTAVVRRGDPRGCVGELAAACH